MNKFKIENSNTLNVTNFYFGKNFPSYNNEKFHTNHVQ